MKPFLKWVGGKTQIIDIIIDTFPKTMNNYHEPFLGGGSVLLAFLDKLKEGHVKLQGKVYASDKNVSLVSVYENIQRCPDDVISELKLLTDMYETIDGNVVNRKAKTEEEAKTSQESFYYWVRHVYNTSIRHSTDAKAAAYFIFLNKTCFRGVYREGPNGFNVPFGHYKNPGIFDATHISNVSQLLQNVIFTAQSFEESLKKVTEEDYIYIDPPYVPVNAKSFVGYTADGFTSDLHVKLFEACLETIKIPSVCFVFSNSDVELVRNNFPADKFATQVVSCKRSIHSKKPGLKANEVLIKYGCVHRRKVAKSQSRKVVKS
jgi:DNA adenine methylase